MDWQQAAALAIVAASFLWLLRRTFFSRGKTGACGGCGTCSHAARPASPPMLVQLAAPRRGVPKRAPIADAAGRTG
jgi:hypothetical protein